MARPIEPEPLDYALNQLWRVATQDHAPTAEERELFLKTQQQARKDLTEMREKLARLEAARRVAMRALEDA